MSEYATSQAERHRLPMRKLVAASIGNAIEWYDWTVYTAFSVYFAASFFPGELALINTLATFALAFFFRPLGGWLLGRFADLRGRKPAMLLTVALMAGGSLIIGLLPSFQVIGWAAPVLLVLARIGQGVSLGGEVSNASAYLAEIAPPDRRGRYSSFFYISTGTALLVASLLGYLLTSVLTEQQLTEFGWRIPFVLGGVLGLVGMWLRSALEETEQFEVNQPKAKALKNPLLLTLTEHPKAVGQLIGFSMLSTLCYYTFFSALTPFAVKTRHADATDVFLALSVATVLFVALQYPMGVLSDRFGRKPQLLVWSAATAVLIVPLSTLVRPGLGGLLVVFCVGIGLYTAMTSIAPAIMSELFPTELRGLGIGAWYNLTVAVFGGTAPLVIQAFAAFDASTLFFWYIAAGAAVAFLVILTLPETRGTELR
ncbi:MHS family alpha-ketoglutarate permease-like MFS transporter [Saccharopolyspora erythraea NRRL 2338]|uniref:MFS transporter n=2 Tax=Saccharopolyspora erythraea TaxID=1836 RepID=A0ABN1C118_SACER|nr:MFS transporter [Saccharopolyspora erythraea]EQD87327.1 major facilitator transporter [Saccharopolyspora erythraea D]PFG94528.1 MHS family alpha-ketoglutarate permease-like MFS transporter [Saccharopolyspora erythraea NRRL 2338]QRK91276.1 MFS transporter [Saccharopolyspora erythraea]CAM00742.1 putative MFS dicarboxylate transporter [Saccharopolyspora erythraea NRRL 2338]